MAIIANIAGHVKRLLPEASVACISGCRGGSALMPEGVEYLKLPAFVSEETEHGILMRPYLDISWETLLRIREAWLRSLIAEFDPDVVFVDDTPSGSFGELLEVLQEARGYKIFGMRGVEDLPERYMRRLQIEGGVRFICHTYDEVFCFTDKRVIDVVESYQLQDLEDRFRYCGYLMRPLLGKQGARNKARMRPDRETRILSSVGGDDNFPLLKIIVESKRHLKAKAAMKVYAGMSLSDAKFKTLQRMATPGVEVHRFTSRHFQEMCESDIYVGMGGYNTLAEILRSGVSSIVIPWQLGEDEQLIHARRLVELGGVTRCIPPEELTVKALAAALDRIIEGNVRPRNTRLNLNGGPAAAQRIVEVLPSTKSAKRGKR
ncbi:MAG: glycosyltransferase [Polyangiaceae bacterium]